MSALLSPMGWRALAEMYLADAVAEAEFGSPAEAERQFEMALAIEERADEMPTVYGRKGDFVLVGSR